MSTAILYEPLPIQRIGVLRGEDKVVIASDFSTFAYMIEEFVALAVTDIAIPRSAPEAALVDSMPLLLRRRVRLIDDSAELDAVNRVLAPVYDEMSVDYDRATSRHIFPERLKLHDRTLLQEVHGTLLRMALGFNQKVQISVDPSDAQRSAQELRMTLRDRDGRAVIAQLESVLSGYKPVPVDGLCIPSASASELVSVFDRLVNDANYAQLSNAVNEVAFAARRRSALARVRQLVRSVIANSRLAAAWDITSKVMSVWSGAPIPEADRLATIVVPRTFPILVDTRSAREAAVRSWCRSGEFAVPLDRSGATKSVGDVQWLPPVTSGISLHPRMSDSFRMTPDGARAFAEALQAAVAMLRHDEDDQ